MNNHLQQLWSLKRAVAVCAVAAALVAALSVYRITLSPPGLEHRTTQIAAATTRVLVDEPRSTVVDLRADTYDLESMTNRALLIGNVMASAPVRPFIARRAGVPQDRIEVSSPLTPAFPRPLAESGNDRQTSDIVKSLDEYRLTIEANPTVPMIDVSAEAPSERAASSLANAAVDGMRDYLRSVAVVQKTPAANQVTLQQLGRARGQEINGGAGLQLGLLVFGLTFALLCTALLAVSRARGTRRGQRDADRPETHGVAAGDAS